MVSCGNSHDTSEEERRNQPKAVSLKATGTSPSKDFQTRTGAYNLPRELPGIDLENTLIRVGGNYELIAKLLTDFYLKYKSTGQTICTLAAKYRSENYDDEVRAEILMMIHTIKGISANLGATELCSASRKLEAAFKNNLTAIKEQPADIEFLLNKFLQAMESVWEAVRILNQQAD